MGSSAAATVRFRGRRPARRAALPSPLGRALSARNEFPGLAVPRKAFRPRGAVLIVVDMSPRKPRSTASRRSPSLSARRPPRPLRGVSRPGQQQQVDCASACAFPARFLSRLGSISTARPSLFSLCLAGSRRPSECESRNPMVWRRICVGTFFQPHNSKMKLKFAYYHVFLDPDLLLGVCDYNAA